MNYYGVTINDDYLAHHGVKGQSWGKKNGPPYPLSSDLKLKNEKNSKLKKLLKTVLVAGATALSIYGGYKFLTATTPGRKIIHSGKESVADMFHAAVLSKSVNETQPEHLKPIVDPVAMHLLNNGKVR